MKQHTTRFPFVDIEQLCTRLKCRDDVRRFLQHRGQQLLPRQGDARGVAQSAGGPRTDEGRALMRGVDELPVQGDLLWPTLQASVRRRGGNVVGPPRHQLSPPFEVAVLVDGFDPVADDVRQSQLGDFTRRVCKFWRPSPGTVPRAAVLQVGVIRGWRTCSTRWRR